MAIFKTPEKKPVKVYTGPHADDQRLRDCGFEVAYRPNKGESIWRSKIDGELWSFREAMYWAMLAEEEAKR